MNGVCAKFLPHIGGLNEPYFTLLSIFLFSQGALSHMKEFRKSFYPTLVDLMCPKLC